jgi:hypothetical protein
LQRSAWAWVPRSSMPVSSRAKKRVLIGFSPCLYLEIE